MFFYDDRSLWRSLVVQQAKARAADCHYSSSKVVQEAHDLPTYRSSRQRGTVGGRRAAVRISSAKKSKDIVLR